MTDTTLVVDGSNIATEGRTVPNLQQLDEAVTAAESACQVYAEQLQQHMKSQPTQDEEVTVVAALQRLTDAPSDRPVLYKLVPVSVMQIRKMWMLVR